MSSASIVSQPDPQVYRGDVVFFFAFDIAYEMKRQPLRTLLGQPVSEFVLDTSKRTPRQISFYRPQMVRLPLIGLSLPRGSVEVERTMKLLPAGALSIAVRVPFRAERLAELVEYHDLAIAGGSLGDEARKLAEEVCHELQPSLVRPHNIWRKRKRIRSSAWNLRCSTGKEKRCAQKNGLRNAAGKWPLS